MSDIPVKKQWDQAKYCEWRAQPDDLVGGWCITFPAEDERTPATGAVQVADFCREEDARHIADLHNKWWKSYGLIHYPFVCPKCSTKSWNPNDKKQGYCARCHDWTGESHGS